MPRSSLFWRIKWLLILLALLIIDIGPFPLTALLCIYIVLFRPRWFKQFVSRLYPPE